MNNNQDNRKNNAGGMQYTVINTLENIQRTEEVIEKTNDEDDVRDLREKNQRREEAIDSMKSNIKINKF